MGDVAGKGPAAALLAALLQGMLVVDAPAGGSPADLVGERRLLAHLAAGTSAPPTQLLDSLFSAVRGFCRDAEPGDDITLSITRFR
jgi:serine phosphatase RsbU (regulator of sigma subunit)